jgi:8-amino-7-oxononanoate synthase
MWWRSAASRRALYFRALRGFVVYTECPMTEPAPLQQIDRTYVRYGKRRLSYFSGCDYFRLASHPAVLQALQEGAKKFGLNVAASRMTTGNHALYAELEARLADYFQAPAALLVSNGYVTNLIVAQTLKGNFSHAIIDEKAHSSLQDAAQMLDCPIIRFQHRNLESFSRAIARCGASAKPLLLTDGMFSHNGEIAPVADYLKLLPRDGLILLDDAHGAGTLGLTGKGTPEFCSVPRLRIIQTITLSKAFGVYGGAILCTPALRKQIVGTSQMFIGSTPLPLPLVNSALQAVSVLQTDKTLRCRLNDNVSYAKAILRKSNIAVAETPAPIIAILPANAREAARLKAALLAQKIFPPFIKYPGGPKSGFFRFVLSSEHTRAQLDALLKALRH